MSISDSVSRLISFATSQLCPDNPGGTKTTQPTVESKGSGCYSRKFDLYEQMMARLGLLAGAAGPGFRELESEGGFRVDFWLPA